MQREKWLLALCTVCAALLSFAPATYAQVSRGTLAVPLDHADPGGPKVDLAYAHFRAREARRGTIVFLAGGPGEAAVRSARDIVEGPLEGLRRRYDIVVVDQRGAGRSTPLRCAGLGSLDEDATIAETTAAVARCGTSLGAGRRFFSTYETVLDLEDLRRTLGVDRIIPLGVSYGGQIAGEYARRFPAQVQAVILDSTSPVEGIDALGRLPQLALPRVLDEICFTPGCESILGDPAVILERAVELLDARPLRGIGPDELYELLRSSDTDPLLRAELPAALQAATQRDAAPLLRLLSYAEAGGASGINQARFLATSCIEGQLPWAPDSDPTERPALLERALDEGALRYAPFPVDAVVESLPATLCLGWPSTPRPPFPPAVEQGPDVPVLVIGGREDLRTPLEDQRRVAAQFPNGQVLSVPGVGHSVLTNDLSGCALRGVRRFLAGLAAEKCPGRLPLFDVALPAFRSLGDVPRPRGRVAPIIGRTMVAVDLTLRDAERWAVAAELSDLRRVPGLRGGRLVVRRNGVVLERYEVVPGVRVSGVLRRGTDVLTVTGSGATGTLTVRRGLIRGVFGGDTITYRPLAPRPEGAVAGAAVS